MRLALGHRPNERTVAKFVESPLTSDRNGPPNAKADRYLRQVIRSPGETPATAFERVRHRLFQYDIFPPSIVQYTLIPGGLIGKGCTVIQRLGVGVIRFEAATRVVETWDSITSEENRESGFAYVTLRGHPERGVATFAVRQEGDAVFVVLTARSLPGTAMTRLGYPIVRAIQKSITKRALNRLTDGA